MVGGVVDKGRRKAYKYSMKIKKVAIWLFSFLLISSFLSGTVVAGEEVSDPVEVEEEMYVPNPSSPWFGLQRGFMRVSENVQLWVAGSEERKVLLEEKFAAREEVLLERIDSLPQEAQEQLADVVEKLEEKQEERVKRMESRIKRVREKREEAAQRLERNLERVKEKVEDRAKERVREELEEDKGEGQMIKERARDEAVEEAGDVDEESKGQGSQGSSNLREIQVDDWQVEVMESGSAGRGNGRVRGVRTGIFAQIVDMLGW